MIKTGNTIVIVSLAILFLLCVCEEEVRKYELQAITDESISHSDCKSSDSIKAASGEQNFSGIKYHYQPSGQKLFLNHINAGFNCCPGKIFYNININSDTINIIEKDTVHVCDCNCLFDLEIEIPEIEAKTYFLNFIEPYAGDQERLRFAINLSDSTDGSFTVKRNKYPWMD